MYLFIYLHIFIRTLCVTAVQCQYKIRNILGHRKMSSKSAKTGKFFNGRAIL